MNQNAMFLLGHRDGVRVPYRDVPQCTNKGKNALKLALNSSKAKKLCTKI